jgi:hypothetical protein
MSTTCAETQILFFEKNYGDLQNPNATATASQASDFADFPRNRKNTSAWITTGSVDLDATTYEYDFSDEEDVDQIILLKHNFKSYTVKYWDGSLYQDFSPAISETTNTAENTHYNVTQVSTTKVQITINGTFVADSDKNLGQFIVTKRLGRLNAWPEIKKPTISRNRVVNNMLSGKASVVENVGQYSADLSIQVWSDDGDLTLIENLYDRFNGFLFWPCGGDETQFSTIRQGYRIEDIFLCKFVDENVPEYLRGIYKSGIVVKIKLRESVS